MPFRSVFPEANEAQWRRKSLGEERQLRVVELINPATLPADVLKDKEKVKKKCSDRSMEVKLPATEEIMTYI